MPHGVNKPGVEAGDLILSPVRFMGWGSCCLPGVRKAAERAVPAKGLRAARLLCCAQWHQPRGSLKMCLWWLEKEIERKDGTVFPPLTCFV